MVDGGLHDRVGGVEVAMGEVVAHPGDAAPGNLGFAGAQSRVDFLGVRGRIDGGPGACPLPLDLRIRRMHTEYVGVREVLLALMGDRPKHGYQLKREYEMVVGSARPLNVGQVYTTIDRLVRDGLVEEADSGPGSAAEARRRSYRLTGAGRDAARAWFFEPPTRPLHVLSDAAERVLAAVRVGGVDPLEVVHAQRVHLLEVLREWRRTPVADGLPAELGADWWATRIEGELAWLDRTEARLRAGGSTPSTTAERKERG